jgi:hypothetical protein
MDARGAGLGLAACGAAVISVALVAPLSRVSAADYSLGDSKLSITGSMYVGTAIRADRQDPKLLPDRNSSLVGIKGDAITPSMGRNQDDGNLNFSRGDAVAAPVKGFVALAYKWRNFGIEASAQGWYDYATASASHPWGHEPNDFAADEPLSDARADARTRFSGIALDSLFAFGRHDFPEHALDWRLGYQSIEWGKRSIAFGGLRDLTPVDYPASLRPGALRHQETRVPIPLALARVTLAKATSVEAYYELQFERSALNQCGTFFVQVDFVAPGCKKVMVGDVSDRTSIAAGLYVKRGRTVHPPDDGQFGIALRHKVDDGATEFGLYAAQFHSRMAFYSGVTSQREGAPFLPGDPGELNPTFYTEFPSSIRMFGAGFESRLSRGLVYGELTFRPNQPLQYNSLDALIAVVSKTLPTPLRDKVDSKGPGAKVRAWERHETVQLQLGAATEIPGALGSAGLGLLEELVYKRGAAPSGSVRDAVRKTGGVRPGAGGRSVSTSRGPRIVFL